jgi:hypothetical protein
MASPTLGVSEWCPIDGNGVSGHQIESKGPVTPSRTLYRTTFGRIGLIGL